MVALIVWFVLIGIFILRSGVLLRWVGAILVVSSALLLATQQGLVAGNASVMTYWRAAKSVQPETQHVELLASSPSTQFPLENVIWFTERTIFHTVEESDSQDRSELSGDPRASNARSPMWR